MKRFGPFTLDKVNQCLWRGPQRIAVAPKAYAVLCHLVDHPGRLITKAELLDAVWPNTFVHEAVLKVSILELRKALDEDAKQPRYIATEHRRGYRFLPLVESVEPTTPAAPATVTSGGLLGRARELQSLAERFQQAAQGRRQIVFLTGEAGIGKSTVVDHFLNEVIAATPAYVVRAHCIEQFGAPEAYYPLFDAFTRVARLGTIPRLTAVLREYAPTWLVEMPGVAPSEAQAELRREVAGATRDRRLREIGHAIEHLAAEQPFVLVCEDLHWSDVSTLDVLSALANQSARARLLVIATYRPVDVILSEHPVKLLKQNLVTRGLASEIALDPLDEEAVRGWLARRFPGHGLPADFTALVQARTEGHPLFVKNVLDFAYQGGLIQQTDGQWRLASPVTQVDLQVPDSLSVMIETQIDRLGAADQELLEQAAIAGVEFDLSWLGGGEAQEERCDALARRGLFLTAPHSKDARYRFLHALYRDVLYRRCPAARRARLHRSTGERIEAQYAGRLGEAATELAVHFAEGRDHARAIRYLRLVSQRCVSRHALTEAMDAHARAMALAEELPDGERTSHKLELLEEAGQIQRLMGQLGPAAEAFERMFVYAGEVGNATAQCRAQLHLAGVSSWLTRERCLAAMQTALEISESQPAGDLGVITRGQAAYWHLLFRGWTGEGAKASADALALARAGTDRALHAQQASRHAFFAGLAGEYREACNLAQEGFQLAIQTESPVDYSVAQYFEAWARLHLADWNGLSALLSNASLMARRNGNELWVLLFGLIGSFQDIETGRFSTARDACAAHLQTARRIGHPLSEQMALVLLGRSELGCGDVAAGLAHLRELEQWQARERILMDWIWAMPLQFALTEGCLAQGDRRGAGTAADRLLSLSQATAEPTWRSLARYAQALVAESTVHAGAAVEQGFAELREREAPLAQARLLTLTRRFTAV